MYNHTPPAKHKLDDLSQSLYLSLVQDERLWWEDLETALHLITERTSEVLGVARVSVWTLNDKGELVCRDLFEANNSNHSSGIVILGTEFPEYFVALESHRIIDAHDAHTDPRTYEFTEPYLKPLGIGAMLDATLRTQGATSGVICLEQLGGPRLWTQEEKSAVFTLADLISQLLIHHDLKNTVYRYEGLLSNMPSAVYRCDNDKDWTMQYISPSIAQISGYPPHEFVMSEVRTYESLIHPDDREFVNNSIKKSIDNNKDFNVEYRIIHRDGNIRWVNEIGRAVHAMDGSVAFLDGVINNITGRVVAEEQIENFQKALQDRNQNLQLVNTISNQLHGLLDESLIYNYSVHNLAKLPYSPSVLILIYDNESDTLQVASTANLAPGTEFSNVRIQLEDCLPGMAIKEKSTQVITDLQSDTRNIQFISGDIDKYLESASALCIPMFDNQQVIGVITLLYKKQRIFSDLEIDTMESISMNITVSVINARHAKRLEHQTLHDTLTGLPNRNSLHIKLKQYMSKSNALALMLIDLDRFKEVNDTLGHAIGDKLICRLGPRIEKILQHQDIFLSRLGGDEFALLINNIYDMDSVKQIANLVLSAIRRPFNVDEVALELGASVGVAVYSDEGIDNHELLRRSDVAMYHAKQTCSGYYIYEPEIDTHTREKLAMMSNLRTAVHEEQFILHYQPKYDIQSNKPIGFEALVRWQHPERGLIFPDHFIELVEMSDLIHPLTDLVIREAIHQVTKWQREYNAECNIAVNISTRNLLDLDFPKHLSNLLRETRFDPTLLELEITESALISDPNRTRDVLNAITALGVKLSIDDFGTGYSSLAYLKQLPIQKLKIDRSFVMEMESNKQDELIVSSTVTLAHNLGLEVIAEGVENEAVLQKLAKMGCDYAQGYHLSRPLPAEDLETRLWPKD